MGQKWADIRAMNKKMKRGERLVDLVHLVHLVSLVYPVSLVQPNERDKPDEPDKPQMKRRIFSAAC